MRNRTPPPGHRTGSARHPARWHRRRDSAAMEEGNRIGEKGTCSFGNTREGPCQAIAKRERRRASEPCRTPPDRRVSRS